MAFAVEFRQMISILWTVAFEEQFYLVWPIIIKFVRNSELVFITIAILFIALLTRCLSLNYAAFPNKMIDSFPLARLDGFMFGAMLAFAFRKSAIRELLNKYRWFVFSGSLFFLYLGLFSIPNLYEGIHFTGILDPYIWKFFLVDLGCVLLVASSIICIPVTFLFSLKPIVYLGRVSYGAYLIHSPCLYATFYYLQFVNNPPVSKTICFFITGFTVIFTIAGLSYRYFEGYFLKLKTRYERISTASSVFEKNKK
jgi:peptidoglycan/LPS O-acetylase OafA/YrhL